MKGTRRARDRGRPESKGCRHSPAKGSQHAGEPLQSCEDQGSRRQHPCLASELGLFGGCRRARDAAETRICGSVRLTSFDGTQATRSDKLSRAVTLDGNSAFLTPHGQPLDANPHHTSATDAVQSPAFPGREGIGQASNVRLCSRRARQDLPDLTSLGHALLSHVPCLTDPDRADPEGAAPCVRQHDENLTLGCASDVREAARIPRIPPGVRTRCHLRGEGLARVILLRAQNTEASRLRLVLPGS